MEHNKRLRSFLRSLSEDAMLYSRPSKRRHRIFYIDLRDELVMKI